MAKQTGHGLWIVAFPPKKSWKRCGRQNSPFPIWSVLPGKTYQAGEIFSTKALGKGTFRNESKTSGDKWRILHSGAKRGAGEQGEVHAAASPEKTVAQAAWTAKSENQPRQSSNKLGSAKKEAGRAYNLVKITIPKPEEPVNCDTFTFSLDKEKLRRARRREGCYLLRTNLTSADPARLWQQYIQLTEIEQAFKELKGDLAIRPVHHQKDERIEAHIFVAFMAYCLMVTLKHRSRQLAPGLTPRSILEKFSTMQMVDVHLPTTDGRYLILPRYTQPDKDLQLLLTQLDLLLPAQPPPRIVADAADQKHAV